MQTRATTSPINREVADGFDIGGTVERVVMGGYAFDPANSVLSTSITE